MSAETTGWAMDARRTGPMTPAARLVLHALADYAGAAGQAFPSVETIGARTGLGESTVRRHLSWLLEAGLIRLGDQELVSHYRADRRPTVYAVRPIPTRLRTETTSQNETPHGVSNRAPRGPDLSATGSRFERHGVPNRDPIEVLNQQLEPRTYSDAPRRDDRPGPPPADFRVLAGLPARPTPGADPAPRLDQRRAPGLRWPRLDPAATGPPPADRNRT